MVETKIIYEAYFVMDTKALEQRFPSVHPNKFYHHLTIAFKPKSLSMPKQVGAWKYLQIVGRLTTNKIDALLIGLPESDKPFPHITLSTAEGVAPSESNVEFKEHSDKIKYFVVPQSVLTAYGYFDGKEVVTYGQLCAESCCQP